MNIIKLGGLVMIPLSAMAIIALAIIFDKIFYYQKHVKISKRFFDLIETYNFDWQKFNQQLQKLDQQNCYRKFFRLIFENKTKPIWWLESRAIDEAKQIEKQLNSLLWILETIITSAPLLGLLGTIMGMMSSFKILGNEGIINPTGITAGVAESLIATGFGLIIAIIALFAFNYFIKLQNQTIDDLERLGTRIIDHLKIDRNEN
jgi:biopolymer transport protein ExbB